MDQPLSGLAVELEQDQATLERELSEIELLLQQAAKEAERHETRRLEAEARLAELERDEPPSPEPLVEARAQLLSQTKRATFMQAQLEVLSGKQRALQRYHDRLLHALPALRQAADAGPTPDDHGLGNGNAASSPVVLAAQEHMRREIARQMHDGPAQSIANIALQAQVVQRLFERQPERAQSELEQLVVIVEHALAATKDFIFDVRPMVLDDLGLVPTLRRSAAERSRRVGVEVRFESTGADRRLASELESALFRVLDDALAGYLSAGSPDILLRLDWSDKGVRAIVRSRSAQAEDSAEARGRAAVAAARHEKLLPAALASMIRQQQHDDEQRSIGLPETTWNDIEQRATAAGISVSLSADRATFEAVA